MMKLKNILNEYGGSEFSKITSLQNFLTVDLDKFERGLKDSKHKAAYKKARKQFMKVVSAVAWEHSKLHEGKLTEAVAVTDNLIMKMKPGSTIKVKGVLLTKDKYGNWRSEKDPNDILVNRQIAKIAKGMKAHKAGNLHIIEGKVSEATATLNLSQEDMDKLHGDGSIDVDGVTITYQEPTNPQPQDEIRESKMIKLKDLLNESYNQSDVDYAMKMAFDNIPGNWHKALKRVKYSKSSKSIKLNMSSYMGPGKVLQKIVDEFNRSMGTKYKIDKNSFVKGSVTGIELREGKLTEVRFDYDRARDVIESAFNWNYVESEGRDETRFDFSGGRDSMWVNSRGKYRGNIPRNPGLRRAIKDLGIVKEGKLTEAYRLGDKWSNDFDYKGMLQIGAKATLSMGLKKLNQLYDSFTDVNYHTEAQDLGNAIEWLQDEGPDHPKVKQFMKRFRQACLKTLRGLR